MWCHQEAAGSISWWHQRLKLQLLSYYPPTFFLSPLALGRYVLHIHAGSLRIQGHRTEWLWIPARQGLSFSRRSCTNLHQSIIVTLIGSWGLFQCTVTSAEPLKGAVKSACGFRWLRDLVIHLSEGRGASDLCVVSCLIWLWRARWVTPL